MQQVWPNANYFAKDLVKDVIEPKIAEALSEYKLNGFKFDRIMLGTIPPRIGGVKVYDKNTSRNEIIMDLDLFYASDCDINFQLAGMKAGIKDFQIHGMVRVIMKPLISKMPLVGGLQIFFLNNPDIDFNLVGVADLLDMPGLSDMLRKIIVEQIGAIMVLPNKLPISLSDEVPSIALRMPEPEVDEQPNFKPIRIVLNQFVSLFSGRSENSCGRSEGFDEEGHLSARQRQIRPLCYCPSWLATI